MRTTLPKENKEKLVATIKKAMADPDNKMFLDQTIYGLLLDESKASAEYIDECDRDFTVWDFLNGLLEPNADQIEFSDSIARTKAIECVWGVLDDINYNSVCCEDLKEFYLNH